MNWLHRLLKDESGIAVEYVLIIAVVVAGVIAAATYFIKPFGDGVTAMGGKISTKLSESHGSN